MVPHKQIERMDYNIDKFNDYQNFLYKRLMFGLKAYPKHETDKMTKEKKQSIMRLHYKAQRELNIWKQTLCNDLCNKFLKVAFPKSVLASILVEKYGNDTDINYFNKVNFKDLKINKEDIIRKFIDLRLLPLNYYKLKNEKLCK